MRFSGSHFSVQDMTQQPPWQDLVATDLHGNEWHFRHIFRGTGKINLHVSHLLEID